MKKIILAGAAILFSVSFVYAQPATTGKMEWKYNHGNLLISGSGDMPDFNSFKREYAPWYEKEGAWGQYACHCKSVAISGLSSVGDEAFTGCKELVSVIIPNSVVRIGNGAFSGCEVLSSMVIPNSVREIGNFAFSKCPALNISIPDSTRSIGKRAFAGSGIEIADIPASITVIPEEAFKDCKKLVSLIIPNSVTGIERLAFNGCNSLEKLVIPNSVKSVGPYAFEECRSLTSVIISSSMTEIRRNTFNNCKALTSVVIPASVRKIDNMAFNGCTSLVSITVQSKTPPVIDLLTFAYVPKPKCVLYVPVGSKAAYKADANWGNFTIIEKNSQGATSTSIAQSTKSGTQDKSAVLTKEGVGCLKKNMLVSKIPANCPGLYDRFEKNPVVDDFNGNYTEYIFYSGKEKVAATKDYGDGKIYYIDVYSPKVSIPDGVYPGMPIKKLLTLKGVKGNYSDGINLTFNGYTINIDNFEQLTAYGEKLFQDAYAKGTEVKLSNACFKEGAKIIFISNY